MVLVMAQEIVNPELVCNLCGSIIDPATNQYAFNRGSGGHNGSHFGIEWCFKALADRVAELENKLKVLEAK